MLDDWGQLLLALASLAVIGSFVAGTIWNMRKGNAAIKWLQGGLLLIGERTTMRWVGTAGVTLNIAKAKKPFRSADTLILLEPRDVFFIWAFFHARGRRDLLIFRARLHDTPAFDLEAFDPHAWSAREVAQDVLKRGWTRLNLNTRHGLTVYHSGVPDLGTAQSLLNLAESVPGKLLRFSVHRAVPNLEIQWQLPDPKSQSARDWFIKLRQLGDISNS